MGFFRGNHKISHFSADTRYCLPSEKGDEDKRRKRVQRERKKLKDAGWKERYFQFRNGDEAGKARAKSRCEAEAAAWRKKTGVILKVTEGCFL